MHATAWYRLVCRIIRMRASCATAFVGCGSKRSWKTSFAVSQLELADAAARCHRGGVPDLGAVHRGRLDDGGHPPAPQPVRATAGRAPGNDRPAAGGLAGGLPAQPAQGRRCHRALLPAADQPGGAGLRRAVRVAWGAALHPTGRDPGHPRGVLPARPGVLGLRAPGVAVPGPEPGGIPAFRRRREPAYQPAEYALQRPGGADLFVRPVPAGLRPARAVPRPAAAGHDGRTGQPHRPGQPTLLRAARPAGLEQGAREEREWR